MKEIIIADKKLRVSMMSFLLRVVISVLLLLSVSLQQSTVFAEVDWEVKSAIQLEETPIDVARVQGGNLTFLLTGQSKVLIYSDAGKLVGTIPVDPSVTDIAVSAKGEQLFLINSQRKTLKTISVDFVVDFNTDGSPFLGPADAGIVVAVFSDFQ